VLRNLLHGQAAAATARLGFLLLLCLRCLGHRAGCARLRVPGFVHFVLVRPARILGSYYLSCQASGRNVFERCRLDHAAHLVGKSCFSRNPAVHDAVEQRVTTETVVTVHSAHHLTGGIQTRNYFAILIHDLGTSRNLETTHAVVDHRCNDRDVELLSGHGRARNDVVEEFLTGVRLSTRLVPRLT